MNAAIDKSQLRQVGLSLAEIQTISMLASVGGETALYLERMKPLSRQVVDQLVAKSIIVLTAPDRGRSMARLTDQGRGIAAQLESMSAAPKVVA